MSIQANTPSMLKHLHLPLTERVLQRSAQEQAAPGPTNFVELLTSGVQQVNQTQQQAAGLVHQLLTGGDVQQAEVMTAVQKADMSFRMLVQIRNKLLQAYEEINAIRI